MLEDRGLRGARAAAVAAAAAAAAAEEKGHNQPGNFNITVVGRSLVFF